MTRTIPLLLIVSLMAAGGGPGPAAPIPLRLVHCARYSDVPCLVAQVNLSPADAIAMAAGDSAGAAHGWSATLAGNRLIGPGAIASASAAQPIRVAIAIDRSVAGNEQGMAFARIALKAFVSSLDSAVARVTLVIFNSDADNAAIAAAEEQRPRAALGALDTLTAADTRGPAAFTAGLRAIALRAERLAHAAPDGDVTVIVVTAGVPAARAEKKTPRPRRRRGAAAPAIPPAPAVDTLAPAIAAIANAGARVWMIQMTSDSTIPDVPAPTGGGITTIRVPSNPNALAAVLAQVRREFLRTRELLFGLPANGTSALARSTWRGTMSFTPASGSPITYPMVWRPPVFALPTYQGVADSGMLTPAIREGFLPGASASSNGTLIAVLLAGCLVALWLLVPRIVWVRPLVAPAAVANRTMSTTRITASSREGAPRKPEDITHQTARRTAMHRG